MHQVFQRLFWISLIGVLMLLQGCALFRRVTKEEKQEQLYRQTLAKVQAERLQFNALSLTGKARIDGETGDLGSLSVNYRIDMVRDSLIIIRISKFIEVARIKMDQDSIYILNRLNQEHIVCDYQLAETYTGLQADLMTLQALLLGEFAPIPEKLQVEQIDQTPWRVTGEEAGTFFRYFITPTLLRLVSIEANNEARDQASLIEYSDFEERGETNLPMQITVNITAPDSLTLGLSHRKVKIDDRSSLSFEVPGNFSRKNCDF